MTQEAINYLVVFIFGILIGSLLYSLIFTLYRFSACDYCLNEAELVDCYNGYCILTNIPDGYEHEIRCGATKCLVLW